MFAATAAWEFGAGNEAEGFFLAAWAGDRWEVGRAGYAKEFDFWNMEGEGLVAFAADVASYFAAYGDDAWEWVGSGTA